MAEPFKVVSKERNHRGGVARIEENSRGDLYVTCTGCGTLKGFAGMAPALANLTSKH